MPLPEYEDLADALLCFIYHKGGPNYQVRARETYEPLANHFELTASERTEPRADGYGGTRWENRVQWTRQRLINRGYVESREHGIWGLTTLGVEHAHSICRERNTGPDVEPT